MKHTFLICLLAAMLSNGCSSQFYATPSDTASPAASSASLSGNSLVLQGTALDLVKSISLSQAGSTSNFLIISQTPQTIYATMLNHLVLAANKSALLTLTSAYAATPINLTVSLSGTNITSFQSTGITDLGVSTAMTLSSAGYVGIGTTTPTYQTTIYGAGQTTANLTDSGNVGGTLYLQDSLPAGGNGGAVVFGTLLGKFAAIKAYLTDGSNNSVGDLAFSTRSVTTDIAMTEKMRIMSNGSVGIGTTSPQGMFHILDKAGSYNHVLITNHDYVSTTTGSGLAIYNGVATGNTYSVLQAFGAGYTIGQPLSLNLNGGNVGVGTSSPTYQEHVYGAGQATANLTDAGNTGGMLYLQDNQVVAGSGGGVVFGMGAGKFAAIKGYTTDGTVNTRGDLTFSTRTLAADTALTEKMRITAAGWVGIGTSPSYNLHVIGTAGLSTGTAWTNASDGRLKDLHGDYEYGLDEIMKLRTVRFNYKKNNALGLPDDKPMIGFVAQDVRNAIPDAVQTRLDGYLELNVDPIHWAAVNAIQDLKRISDEQALQLKGLTVQNSRLLEIQGSLREEIGVLREDLKRLSKAASVRSASK